MADELDRAISLYEDDQLAGAAHLLVRTHRAAVTRNDTERLVEIGAVVSLMQSYLTGADRAVFDEAFQRGREKQTAAGN